MVPYVQWVRRVVVAGTKRRGGGANSLPCAVPNRNIPTARHVPWVPPATFVKILPRGGYHVPLPIVDANHVGDPVPFVVNGRPKNCAAVVPIVRGIGSVCANVVRYE